MEIEKMDLESGYRLYSLQCERAAEHILTRLEDQRKFEKFDNSSDLFGSVTSRTKALDSARDKWRRKYRKKGDRANPTIAQIMDTIQDVAGIRIIVPFRDNVYEVAKIIQSQFVVKEIDDYIEKPKQNGYRSLHLTVWREIDLPNGTKVSRPVEIQIRTKAMDVWATVEHKVFYKNEKNKACADSNTIQNRLKIIADALNEIDSMAIDLRDLDFTEKLVQEVTSSERLSQLATTVKKS